MCGEGGKYVDLYSTLVELQRRERFWNSQACKGRMILKMVLNLEDV
jgi:hypothetical protein